MGRASEDLSPVSGKPFDVLWIDAVRERVVQLRVLQAALVMCSCQREEGGFAAGELEYRGAGHRGEFSGILARIARAPSWLTFLSHSTDRQCRAHAGAEIRL